MYGTVARFRVKPGMESKLDELGRRFDELHVPGHLGEIVYQMDKDGNEYYQAVLFESKEAYVANASSPEQDARYRELLELLEGPPDWHDGEIVHSYLATGGASGEANIALVRRWIEEAFNNGNLSRADQVFAANYVDHDPGTPDLPTGPEAARQVVTTYRTAFPDVHLTIDDIVAIGDRLIFRWTATGTHQGDLRGIPATGKRATVTGITISRVANGKVVEDYTSWDTLGLMQQLGLAQMPAPTAVAEEPQVPMEH